MSPMQQILLGAGKGIPKPNFDYASQVDNIEGDGLTKSQNPKVTADPHNENRYAICFTDDDGTKDGFIRIVTRNDTSITLSPVYDAADSSNVGKTNLVFDPSNSGKLIYCYQDSKMRARVISFSGSAGSESFSRSSDYNLSNLGFGGHFVPMGNTGRYLIPCLHSGVCKVRIMTASSSAITHKDSAGGSDAISMTTTSSTAPHIAVDPTDATKGMMCTVNTSEDLVVRALTFSGSGSSANVSVGAETKLTPGILDGGGYPQNKWGGLIVGCGAGKYVAFARGGDSPHNNKIVGVAFDYDGSSYTLGSATYAPQNLSTDEPYDWSASNRGGNIIGLVGRYTESSTRNPSHPLCATVCTRSDNRTLSYTDVETVANTNTNKLFASWTAQGYDDANTHFSVLSNDGGTGTNFSNCSGVLWQAGGE